MVIAERPDLPLVGHADDRASLNGPDARLDKTDFGAGRSSVGGNAQSRPRSDQTA
jgi:hypothetical protein